MVAKAGAQRIAYWPALAWANVSAGTNSRYWGWTVPPSDATQRAELAAVYAALNGPDPAFCLLRLSSGTRFMCDIPLRAGSFGASAFLGDLNGIGVVAGFEAVVTHGVFSKFWMIPRVGWGTVRRTSGMSDTDTDALIRTAPFFDTLLAAEVWKL